MGGRAGRGAVRGRPHGPARRPPSTAPAAPLLPAPQALSLRAATAQLLPGWAVRVPLQAAPGATAALRAALAGWALAGAAARRLRAQGPELLRLYTCAGRRHGPGGRSAPGPFGLGSWRAGCCPLHACLPAPPAPPMPCREVEAPLSAALARSRLALAAARPEGGPPRPAAGAEGGAEGGCEGLALQVGPWRGALADAEARLAAARAAAETLAGRRQAGAALVFPGAEAAAAQLAAAGGGASRLQAAEAGAAAAARAAAALEALCGREGLLCLPPGQAARAAMAGLPPDVRLLLGAAGGEGARGSVVVPECLAPRPGLSGRAAQLAPALAVLGCAAAAAAAEAVALRALGLAAGLAAGEGGAREGEAAPLRAVARGGTVAALTGGLSRFALQRCGGQGRLGCVYGGEGAQAGGGALAALGGGGADTLLLSCRLWAAPASAPAPGPWRAPAPGAAAAPSLQALQAVASAPMHLQVGPAARRPHG
jgi:hypothetical protein